MKHDKNGGLLTEPVADDRIVDPERKIEQLETRVAELEGQLEELRAQHVSVQAELADSEKALRVTSANRDALQKEVNSLRDLQATGNAVAKAIGKGTCRIHWKVNGRAAGFSDMPLSHYETYAKKFKEQGPNGRILKVEKV